MRKDAETEHGHVDGLHQWTVEESSLDTSDGEYVEWKQLGVHKETS